MRKSLFLLGLVALLSIAWRGETLAASTSPAGGITMSPFLQKVDIAPGDTSQKFSVTLRNNTPAAQEIELINRDFGSLDETGGLLFEGANDYSQKYGLASWLSLETSSLVLEPGESKTVLATIENRDSLGPGGHYGAIIASISSSDDGNGNRVSVRQQLTSLVFANKTGGARYDLELASISRSGSRFSFPSQVTLRFRNPGNVHVTPRGTVTVSTKSGKVLATGLINDGSAFVLPETFRQISVPLQIATGAGIKALPGTYNITVNYRYDGYNTFVTRKVSFTYVNLPLILGGLVLLILAIRFKKLFRVILSRIRPIKKAEPDIKK